MVKKAAKKKPDKVEPKKAKEEKKDPQAQAARANNFHSTASGAAGGDGEDGKPNGDPTVKKARVRRTNDEIIKDRETLKVDGYDMIAQFLKSLSDNDVKRYGLAPVGVEFYYPIAKDTAKLINYFMPQAKEIYFVGTMWMFQVYTIMKTRSDLIDQKHPKKKKPEPQQQESVDLGNPNGGFPPAFNAEENKV